MSKKIQAKVNRIRRCIEREQAKCDSKKEVWEKQLDVLYEELAGFKKGDKVKVKGLWIRDIHRDSDIEILGKTGIVSNVTSGWITVKLEKSSSGYALQPQNLEKI
jgi:ribosomal protein L21E